MTSATSHNTQPEDAGAGPEDARAQLVSFRVEQVHIGEGERCQASRCPVALAMQDAGLTETFVLPTIVYYTDADGVQRVANPGPGYSDWIRLYDGGYPVSPMRFELEGLEQWAEGDDD